MPVGVVVARVAGDNALSDSGLLTPNEAGRMLGIFDLLAPVMLACVDSFDKLSGGHSKEVRHVSGRGGRDAVGRRLKFLL